MIIPESVESILLIKIKINVSSSTFLLHQYFINLLDRFIITKKPSFWFVTPNIAYIVTCRKNFLIMPFLLLDYLSNNENSAEMFGKTNKRNQRYMKLQSNPPVCWEDTFTILTIVNGSSQMTNKWNKSVWWLCSSCLKNKFISYKGYFIQLLLLPIQHYFHINYAQSYFRSSIGKAIPRVLQNCSSKSASSGNFYRK